MAVCVIPARGGSKRIPRKNIRSFHGTPMIGWSIAAARACCLFDRIVVSTDDAEVSEIARGLGAEVPFSRPNKLANDHAGTVPVVTHAVEALDLDSDVAVCCLYATAPFVKATDLAATWASQMPVFGGRAHGVELPSSRVVDIDTPEDWDRAEALFQVLKL